MTGERPFVPLVVAAVMPVMAGDPRFAPAVSTQHRGLTTPRGTCARPGARLSLLNQAGFKP